MRFHCTFMLWSDPTFQDMYVDMSWNAQKRPSCSCFKLQPTYRLPTTTIITTKIFQNQLLTTKCNQWTGRCWEQWAQSCDYIWKNIQVVQLNPPQDPVKNAIFLGWAFVINLIFGRQELQTWCVFFFFPPLSFLRWLILNVFLTEWFFWLTSVICILKNKWKKSHVSEPSLKAVLPLTVPVILSGTGNPYEMHMKAGCRRPSHAVQGCVKRKEKMPGHDTMLAQS